MHRPEPADTADERAQLTQWLEFHRATVLRKVEDLDREQMARTVGASTLTLAGLLKHLAAVEDGWFRRALLGEPPADWYAHFDGDPDPDWDLRTARHAGHADLLREAIDGETGR
jgi:uncharacterized damage-inducible protein DinB